MTYGSLKHTQQQTDLLAADHLATCGDCGDLAHPTATCCEGCGAHLYPRKSTGPARDSLDERSVQGQEGTIMASPTGRVVARNDGEDLNARMMATALEWTEAALARSSNVVPIFSDNVVELHGHSKKVPS